MDKILNYKNLKTLHENEDVIVFQAENLTDHKRCIVKTFKSTRPSPEQLAAMRHEYQINNGLTMQGLIHCQQLVEQADFHILVFDDVGGVTLSTYLDGRALTLEQFFPIALEIVICLAELHDNKIIHKDIKPDNLLINPESLSVKLLDLSIASQLSVENQEVVAVNKLEGSLPYIAPEQTGRMNRPIDYRSDYYALGVTFYELLTGALPFVGADPLAYVYFHLAIEPEPVSTRNPDVPITLSKIVAKLMSKQAEDRYQSAAGLQADLQHCFQEWTAEKKISDFTLGEHEAFNALVISPKVYGRDSEIATLLSTFERVATGASECLLISGYSGIGKTRLVNEIQKPITSHQGNFISGKFDQLQRAMPYTAFTDAFSSLFKHWLTQSGDKLNQRKEKLEKALGQSAQVIIEFFPELEIVMGKQPEIEKLPPEQAQNRFLYQFQNFIECIATPEEPLVMFIDDLQWIDQGSLRLLETILTTQNVKSLLFIGAYRDNEVDGSHPFIKLIDKLKKANLVIGNINIKPLELVHTQEFLADSLKMDGDSVRPLAEILFEKTAGNPFFALEFLKECVSQEILTYDHNKCLWHWDLEKISNMSGSDNVVDLILAKINKLPEESQKLLQISSCLGMSFDSSSLRHIRESDELEILDDLSPVLKAGMIQKIDNGLRYKFIHDRIQQAAYQTIPKDEKEMYHLVLARMMLNKAEGLDADGTFEVLDHLKRCAGLEVTEQERTKIAGLSLMAGRQAQDSGAYQAAHDYLVLGLNMAEHFDWEVEYRLLWNLNMVLIESLYMQGSYQEALTLGDRLLIRSNSDMDKVYVYLSQMSIHHNYLKNHEIVIEIGIKASSILGFQMPPVRVLNAHLSFMFEYYRERLICGRGEKFSKLIISSAGMDDIKYNLLHKLVYLVGSSATFAGNHVYMSRVIMAYVLNQKKHGLSNISVSMILNLSGQISYMINKDLQDFEIYFNSARDFIKTSSLSTSEQATSFYSVVISAAYFDNFNDMIVLAEQTIQKLIDSGNLQGVERAEKINLATYCLSDKLLIDVKNKAIESVNLYKKIKMQNLVDTSNFILLSCKYLAQEENLSLEESINNIPSPQVDFGLFYVFNAYLSEDYVLAKNMLEINNGVFGTVNPLPKLFYYVSYILIIAQLYPQSSTEEKKEYARKINIYLNELKTTSDYNPDNYLHAYLLCKAEAERIKGNHQKALELYQQAITAAVGHSYHRWAAIANERAGELYLELGNNTAASAFLQEATYFFQQWGCNLKVNLLKKKYYHLLKAKQIDSNQSVSQIGISSVMMAKDLDFMTMLKANQAISTEIQLDKLLPRILQVVIESAGADKAAFIGLKRNSWTVECFAEFAGGEFIASTEKNPLTTESDLPEGLISYSIRSGITEVIGDMTTDKKCRELPYVIKHKSKSGLCLPVIRDDKIMAVLYLENNLTTDAFTPGRVQLLQALSTQIAISLENARYFEHTQELFRSTERFVPKEFLELLGRNNIEEVMQGDNARVEMSAIFADLRDFTTISESIEPEELTYILNTYLKYMAPIIRNNHGFVNRVLGDGILALFPNEPQDAVQASVEMLQAVPLLNKELNEAGFQSLLMGIGVNTGPAMLCALGEAERIEANVVSDMVNAASRIEGLNKMYGTNILVSDLTYYKLKNPEKFNIRMVDNVRVKGKAKALGLYEILPISSFEEQRETAKYILLFEKAFEQYRKGNFQLAKKSYEDCLLIRKSDSVAVVFKERCETFIKNPPKDWDGITTMLDK